MAWAKARSRWRAVRRLAARECRQNRLVYILPLPFWVSLAIYNHLAAGPLALGPRTSMAILAGGAILAMVYGQQAFAGEADRRTLDFLLTKPVSPAVLAAVKYALNLGSFMIWTTLFARGLKLDLSPLSIPAGAASGWVFFGLSTLAGMSYLAGILTRGAERLLTAVLLTGGLGAACYGLWNQALTWAAARFFWPDIPPQVNFLITAVLPAALTIGVLLWPPVIVLWLLRSRAPLRSFKPAWRLVLAWGILVFLIEGTWIMLGPAVWPLPRDFKDGGTGDWHPRAGIVLAGPLSADRVNYLAVARLGGRARPIYKGAKVYAPRWSPDGRSIAFVDDGWIKILRGKTVVRVAKGEFPYWSADGQSLAFAEMGEGKTARSIWRIVPGTRRKEILWDGATRPLGLAWDSERGRLYLFDRGGSMLDIDLAGRKTVSIRLDKPVKLSMQNPWGVIGQDGFLYLAVSYEREAHVFKYKPGMEKPAPVDACAGRVSPAFNVIVSPADAGYLWPRIDRAFEYRGFTPVEDEEEHHHEHEE